MAVNDIPTVHHRSSSSTSLQRIMSQRIGLTKTASMAKPLLQPSLMFRRNIGYDTPLQPESTEHQSLLFTSIEYIRS